MAHLGPCTRREGDHREQGELGEQGESESSELSERGDFMFSYTWDGYELEIKGPGVTVCLEAEEAGEILSELEEAETAGEIQYILRPAAMVVMV